MSIPPEALKEQQEAHRQLIHERYEQLPLCSMPTRDNTVLTWPSHDYRIDKETHKGILSSFSLFAGELEYSGSSDIGTARNNLFNAMLRTPFEWMICLDTDIGFTKADLEALLEWKGPTDYAVQGVYAKKNEREETVTQGLGFSRIHRCVLEAIKLHLPFRYLFEGVEFQDFCITGASEKMGMLREDSGFWFLCSQVGVTPRLVSDLSLRHYGGRRAYELTQLQKRTVGT